MLVNPRLRDLTGQRFGRWTVIVQDRTRSPKTYWRCRCDCGTERSIWSISLIKGLSKSCGCTQYARPGRYIDGRAVTPEGVAWRRMLRRCDDPKCSDYYLYGARGVRVCERWHNFALFVQDMGSRPSPRHSVDRINNQGNYEPGNCRWATPEEQANNKRNTRLLTLEGRSLTLQAWERETGIKRSTITQRIDRSGWSVEQALTIPAVAGQKISSRRRTR